uniref:Lysozyme n=1 Tax=Trichoplusia ni TaxID=7111 RepID=A9XXB6_TRINI|nr:lysozyme [Trichoplusia ni]
MKLAVFVCVLFCCTCIFVESKHFERCELVQELRKQEFPENKLNNWVCLIESESSRRTDVIGPANSDGSRDYGLFQINDNIWCSNTTVAGKGCQVTCAELITDDITKASVCAKKIYRKQGFFAWHGWTKRCQKFLQDISHC